MLMVRVRSDRMGGAHLRFNKYNTSGKTNRTAEIAANFVNNAKWLTGSRCSIRCLKDEHITHTHTHTHARTQCIMTTESECTKERAKEANMSNNMHA